MSRDLFCLVTTALMLSAWGGVCPAAVPVEPMLAALNGSGTDLTGFARGEFQQLPVSPATNYVALGTDWQLDVGLPEHWRVFAVTNEPGYNHGAFALFLTPPLSTALPADPITTNAPSRCAPDPDLDLYVSSDPALAELSPTAIEASLKSLSRGPMESLVLSDAAPGVYYIAVKSESLVTSEFGVTAVFSTLPFEEPLAGGGSLLRGLGVPQAIPDAESAPGLLQVIAVGSDVTPVHRVVVLETVRHDAVPQLRGTLSHDGLTIGLHAPGSDLPSGEWRWDDSNEEPGAAALRTAGPGSLGEFPGGTSAGLWLLSVADLTNSIAGTLESFALQVETEDLAGGQGHVLAPGGTSRHVVTVPVGATNVTVTATVMTEGADLTLQFYSLEDFPPQTLTLQGFAASGSLSYDVYSSPPVNPGNYTLTLTNPGAMPVEVQIAATVLPEDREVSYARFGASRYWPLADSGLTALPVEVTFPGRLTSASVAARIRHPRVSDLLLTLVSPQGTRVRLMDHRGGLTTNGLGNDVTFTNVMPISSSGGPTASTNVIDVGHAAGTVSVEYSFYGVPDEMRVYRGAARIFDSGMVSESGRWNIEYGASESTNLTVVMNEGDNYNTNTAWFYIITSTRPGSVPALFLEDSTAPPLKFARPPFTNATPNPVTASNAVILLPEQSLQCVAGERVEGTWTLEVVDHSPGPEDASPALVRWELYVAVAREEPLPMPVTHGSPRLVTVSPEREWQHFEVELPMWASWATNVLVSSSAPLNVWYSAVAEPTGGGGDEILAAGVTRSAAVLGSSTVPPITPGGTYYLSLQNTGSVPVSAEVRVDFDVIELNSSSPVEVAVPAGSVRYFVRSVSEDTASLRFGLDGLSADLDLAVNFDLPLPTQAQSSYFSGYPDLEPERVDVTMESRPVPVQPGRWYVAVLNPGTAPASARLTVATSPVPAVIYEVNASPEGVELKWTGPLGASFEVQSSASLNPTEWTPVAGSVTSADRTFRFVDVQPGFAPRFYRVVQVGGSG